MTLPDSNIDTLIDQSRIGFAGLNVAPALQEAAINHLTDWLSLTNSRPIDPKYWP